MFACDKLVALVPLVALTRPVLSGVWIMAM
jgi:hypothetical protein